MDDTSRIILDLVTRNSRKTGMLMAIRAVYADVLHPRTLQAIDDEIKEEENYRPVFDPPPPPPPA